MIDQPTDDNSSFVPIKFNIENIFQKIVKKNVTQFSLVGVFQSFPETYFTTG